MGKTRDLNALFHKSRQSHWIKAAPLSSPLDSLTSKKQTESLSFTRFLPAAVTPLGNRVQVTSSPSPSQDEAICELPYALVASAWHRAGVWHSGQASGGRSIHRGEVPLSVHQRKVPEITEGYCICLFLPPIPVLSQEVGSGFHSKKSKEMLWTWCLWWLKNNSPRSLTFRIHQLSTYGSFQIFITTALSLCEAVMMERGGKSCNLSQSVRLDACFPCRNLGFAYQVYKVLSSLNGNFLVLKITVLICLAYSYF